MRDWLSLEGAPQPLGVTWIAAEAAYNFALYSRHATGITLLLFDDRDFSRPIQQIPLDYVRHKSGRVWHCRVTQADAGRARFYGYRVDGPFTPALGHRFDPEKVLLDPWARHVFLPPGFSPGASTGRGSNAGRAPLGEMPGADVSFAWGDDCHPRHGHDAVIYEMHVRGFTQRASSGVSELGRGRFAGVIEKIPYLRELGVTVLELLPVALFDPEPGGNYWGYMPLNFFELNHAYASRKDGQGRASEFQSMVKALHAANIEVVLDVVFTHTSELDADGPTYSCRGIDNSTYYLLAPNGSYRDDTGTGNVLRTAHPAVRRLIVDALRYWVSEMHVDGFRFDLASIFTRDLAGNIATEDPPIISEIGADPAFAEVRLIAEPWDVRAYQLGSAFPGVTWAQWNDRFRADVRSFVKGTGRIADLMTRLYGSTDLFSDALPDARRPQQSINFVSCHDGFCLYDVVSYARKHNDANGHGNQDGQVENFSWNWGVEGDAAVPPDILALRRQLVKNFCCILFLSNGTPMFCAGDEFMHTQRGNNNPYNQDNDTTWLDWDRLATNADVFRFFKLMIAFRRAHPSIGRGRFWGNDVRWYGLDGPVDLGKMEHRLAFCLDGAAERDADLYVMINAFWEEQRFVIQEGNPGSWVRVIDTAKLTPDDFLEAPREERLVSGDYLVGARSVVVLTRAAADSEAIHKA